MEKQMLRMHSGHHASIKFIIIYDRVGGVRKEVC
jgi:hypothetical protein